MSVGSNISWTTLTGASSVDGSIAGWLNHSAIAGVADTIIAEAEAFIYRDLRHWRMLTSTTGTFTTNPGGQAFVVDFIGLPADYLEDKLLMITGTNVAQMKRKTLEEVIQMWGYDGNGFRIVQQPYFYYNDQTNLKFDSPPDQAYPYLLYYYQQPAALNAGNTTNFITQFYPRLVRATCCMMAAEFMKDAGTGNYDRSYWEQVAMGELAKAQVESDRQQRSQDIGMILQ